MHVVSGRESCLPRFVKEDEVSPRPWRRRSTLVGWGDEVGGGVTVRWRDEEKSPTVRRPVDMPPCLNTSLTIA